MNKRFVAICVTIMLTLLSLPMSVQAENEDENIYGDAIVTVSVENPECLQIHELEAAQITAVIGLKNKPEFTPLEIPVEALNMEVNDENAELSFWLGYKEKTIEKAFLDYLSDIQGDIFADISEGLKEDSDTSQVEDDAEEMLDEASAVLNEITIELQGLPEHYKLDMETSSCTIVTNEVVKAIVGIIETLLELLYPDINMETIGIQGLFDEILKQEGTSLDELIAELAAEDPELAGQVRQLFEEIDSTLEYMQSDKFPGILFVGATLSCACPVKEYYEITHEYYKKVDGKLVYVNSEYEDYEDYEGKVIKAEDYVKCEYDGIVYEFKGSFNPDVVFEDVYYEYDWSSYALDEITVGDEEIGGLLLRYEIEEETDPIVPGEMEEPIMSEKEVAPATGDEQNVRFYLAIVAVAVGVIILTKRQIEE